MTRINTNVAALQAFHQLGANQFDLSVRLERLSTGLRINRGRDDPAGLIISELLRSEIRATDQAIDNSTRANNVIATAEGAMNEMSALLLDLEALVVQTANEAGLTEGEVDANQLEIDAILSSIDRIAVTTEFAGQKLLDGTLAYTMSGIDPTDLASVRVFSTNVTTGTPREITVEVTQSAETANLILTGTNPGGLSVLSSTTVEVKGSLGRQLLSFADGATLDDVRGAINAGRDITGVSAIITASGGGASALVLNSLSVGSDAFVSVEPLSGNFVEAANEGMSIRDDGLDAAVLINGQIANVKGLRADVNSQTLDTRIYLSETFGQSLGTSTFHVTGGGAIFQITSEVNQNGQVFVGIPALTTTNLGTPIIGLLHTLRSGFDNDLFSKNFPTAQTIVEEAINQVASMRGRLGSIQKNHIDTNIASQRIALENLTASESIIRDADMAEEISALTRAQILVQSTQSTLQIANQVPQSVLTLLG